MGKHIWYHSYGSGTGLRSPTLTTPYPMRHMAPRAQRGEVMLIVLTQNINHSLYKSSGGDYIYQCADLTPVRVAGNNTRRKFNSFS